MFGWGSGYRQAVLLNGWRGVCEMSLRQEFAEEAAHGTQVGLKKESF